MLFLMKAFFLQYLIHVPDFQEEWNSNLQAIHLSNDQDVEYTDDPLKFATNEDAPDYPSSDNLDPIAPFSS